MSVARDLDVAFDFRDELVPVLLARAGEELGFVLAGRDAGVIAPVGEGVVQMS